MSLTVITESSLPGHDRVAAEQRQMCCPRVTSGAPRFLQAWRRGGVGVVGGVVLGWSEGWFWGDCRCKGSDRIWTIKIAVYEQRNILESQSEAVLLREIHKCYPNHLSQVCSLAARGKKSKIVLSLEYSAKLILLASPMESVSWLVELTGFWGQ